jgi:hypothetical protein
MADVIRNINGKRVRISEEENNRIESGSSKIDNELNRKDTRREVAREFARQTALINQSFNAIQEQNVIDQQARVGGTTALLANAGIAGSARGQAQQTLTAEAGRQIAEQTEARRAESMLGIEQAIQQTTDNRFGQQQALQQEQAMNAGQLQQRVLISNLVNEGVTDPRDIYTRLNGLVDYETIQSIVPEQEVSKEVDLSQGEARFAYNTQTGRYERVAYNPKTYAPKTSTRSI